MASLGIGVGLTFLRRLLGGSPTGWSDTHTWNDNATWSDPA